LRTHEKTIDSGRGSDAALDLPLKILVAEDAKGRVRISYNAPAYL